MSSSKTEIAVEKRPTSSNPLDAIPDEIPFDVPYGRPISLDRAQAVIQAAVAEAKKRNWKMNLAVADSGGNLVAFQRMDGAMLASIQIAEHKAKEGATFRRPTKVFKDGINLILLGHTPNTRLSDRSSKSSKMLLCTRQAHSTSLAPTIRNGCGARLSARVAAREVPIRKTRWSLRRALQ
jgi:hypothetical protein